MPEDHIGTFVWYLIGFGTYFAESDYVVIWPILRAIDNAFSIGLALQDEDQLRRQAEEVFASINMESLQVLKGVVLAIDGWVMSTRKPTMKEVENVMSSRNRKRVWGIVILAGCDARTKFHMWNEMNTGSTNDCTAWHNCRLKQLIADEHQLPLQFF
jgi:hypothetical protein